MMIWCLLAIVCIVLLAVGYVHSVKNNKDTLSLIISIVFVIATILCVYKAEGARNSTPTAIDVYCDSVTVDSVVVYKME